jgi:exoribonuclease-2
MKHIPASLDLANDMNDKRDHTSWLTEKAHQAMIDNGFEPEFSDAVEAQLKQIESQPGPPLDASIKDLRDLLWSSIDNESSGSDRVGRKIAER